MRKGSPFVCVILFRVSTHTTTCGWELWSHRQFNFQCLCWIAVPLGDTCAPAPFLLLLLWERKVLPWNDTRRKILGCKYGDISRLSGTGGTLTSLWEGPRLPGAGWGNGNVDWVAQCRLASHSLSAGQEGAASQDQETHLLTGDTRPVLLLETQALPSVCSLLF